MSDIQKLKNRVLDGGSITKEEAMFLISIEEKAQILELAEAANEIRKKFRGNKIDFCSIINVKSNNCSEDCKFCSQSAYYSTEIDSYPFLDEDTVIEKAKEAKKAGSTHYGLVAAVKQLNDEQFDHVLKIYKRLSNEVDIDADGSLGFLTEERAKKLKEAGLKAFNHNLETGPNHFGNICSTHTFEDRLDTIRNCKKAGITVCSGGILGMGESKQDRVDLAWVLKEEEVPIIPINILDPRPGTPLEGEEKISRVEVIKTIAVFRFLNPKAIIKLAGGREGGLGEEQLLALEGGTDSLLIGGYLTTMGSEVENDHQLVKEAGFEIDLPNETVSSEC